MTLLLPCTTQLLVSLFVSCYVAAQSVSAPDIIELTSNQFHDYIVNGTYFDVIIDVRSIDEWNSGHIANTTLMVNLASYTPNGTTTSSSTNGIANPKELNGCQYCTIAAYCRSGSRAGQALLILQEQGFMGQLYNGLGVNQWTDAGYELTADPNSTVVPLCTTNTTVSDTCKKKATTTSTGEPATSKTESPTTIDNDKKEDSSSSSLDSLSSLSYQSVFVLCLATIMLLKSLSLTFL